uniref:Uncharacterized protein n=1 Tax=Tanacetum cinerariifolium TaxID=118510 RepID=A0A699ILU9_TANCI|nr:hypothetical protein [Tanacetum cinerariifolium]
MIERERDEVGKAIILSLTLHNTALAAEAQQNIAKVQEKLDEEKIEKMVEGDEDEESYATEFADSMINDDVDDSGTKIEPESHKEHPKIVNDDDDQFEKEKNNEEIEKEKKDEEIKKGKKHDDYEKIDEVVMEKDNDDDDVEKIVPELTVAKTNEMINKEMPRLVNLAVDKDRKVDPINAQEMISKEFATHAPKMIEELFRKHMQHTTLNIYPTISSSTAGKSTANL